MTTTIAGPATKETSPSAPREYRWTADAFYQAAAAGVFADPARLELIHGRIIEKMPQGSLHRAGRLRISRLLRSALEPALAVADECPIHIAFDGEPVPDIAVLYDAAAAEDTARHPAPEDVALLVEIAVSSEKPDQSAKALLYAQAGVGDYWVALPEAGEIVVHRDPTLDGYQSVTRVGEEGAIAPLAASASVLSVRKLLGLPVVGEGTP